jgi:VanZ family protein
VPGPGRLLFALFLGAFLLVQWVPRVPFDDRVDDKVAHAGLYYLLALALWPLVPATDALARAGVVVSIGFLLAVLVEFSQAPPRVTDTRDLFADVLGLVAASGPMAWAGLHPAPALRAPAARGGPG